MPSNENLRNSFVEVLMYLQYEQHNAPTEVFHGLLLQHHRTNKQLWILPNISKGYVLYWYME